MISGIIQDILSPSDYVIHIIGNIYIPANPQYLTDAHNIKIIQLCQMFHSRGHDVIFYGDSEAHKYVPATKYYNVIETSYYDQIKKDSNNFTDPRYMTIGCNSFEKFKVTVKLDFLNKLEIYLKPITGKHNIVLHVCDTYSSYNFPEYKNDFKHIEASSMGGHIYNEYVVFITEPWRQIVLANSFNKGQAKIKYSKTILPWFDPNDFLFNPQNKKKNTFLYLARCMKNKGFDYFMQLAKHFPDKTFWVAGAGYKTDFEHKFITADNNNYYFKDYPNVKYWGVADKILRKQLLSQASALIQPTLYFEPCGWNVIEALLSGTPVITPREGGFMHTTETLPHNDKIVSYKFKVGDSWDYWSQILEDVQNIKPERCRAYALCKFEEGRAYKEYMKFFSEII